MNARLHHRKRHPRPARLLFGIAIFFTVIAVYGAASSLRAAAIAVGRSIVHIAIASEPIKARAFLFNVPFRRQQHALSCEVAALRMALAGIGTNVAEWDLWLELPKDQTPKTVTRNGTVWGDPNVGFVGNVDGRMPSTGYGVFSGPLLEVANVNASATRVVVDNGHAIDAALSQKHPIIVWTEIGPLPPRTYRWTTPAGTTINAPAYEHTVVIVGYRGTADAVEGVYVVDPLTSLRYETWSVFLARTAPFGHVGIEVAPR
jgi:uncharacterized protein YvpB